MSALLKKTIKVSDEVHKKQVRESLAKHQEEERQIEIYVKKHLPGYYKKCLKEIRKAAKAGDNSISVSDSFWERAEYKILNAAMSKLIKKGFKVSIREHKTTYEGGYVFLLIEWIH